MSDGSPYCVRCGWEEADHQKPLGLVTRVELIENGNRIYTRYGAENVRTFLQDEGRTLKVAVTTET